MTLDLNKPLPKEYPMLHVTCLLRTTAIIKGNREGLLMLAEAITNALAYGKVEAEVYKVGGDTVDVRVSVAETFEEILML